MSGMWATKCTTEGRFPVTIELCVWYLSTSSPDSVFLIWPQDATKLVQVGTKDSLLWVGHSTLSDSEYISVMHRLLRSLGDTFVLCVFFKLLCIRKQSQFALFSALTLHTGILTIEAASAIPNFLLSHFLLQITGCLSCCYFSVADMPDAVYSIWPYSVIWACPPSSQLKSSWSDRQVSKQPHSSLVRCTRSLAKSLSFQYLKPSSKKQICTASTLLCISSCAGCSHPHT